MALQGCLVKPHPLPGLCCCYLFTWTAAVLTRLHSSLQLGQVQSPELTLAALHKHCIIGFVAVNLHA